MRAPHLALLRSALLQCLYMFVTTSAAQALDQDVTTVRGQSVINFLRHTAALSDLPSKFGKHGSMLLKSAVSSPSNVWSAVHPDVRLILSDPKRLDWLVSDVSTDTRGTVTINGGFFCLDRGRSSSQRLMFWASGMELVELTSIFEGLNGARRGLQGDGSINDITMTCWEAERNIIPLNGSEERVVEHREDHRGTGVAMRQPIPVEPFVDDDNVFWEIARDRAASDASDEVVYHKKGIPVVFGVTFDTGVRLLVSRTMTEEMQPEARTPMTILGAIAAHSRAHLGYSFVAEEKSRTTRAILLLSVLSSGLAVILAVWWIAEHVAETNVRHAEEIRRRPAYSAVAGGTGWSSREKAMLLVHTVSVTILAAPLALAVVEQNVDPRVSVEVRSGASVYYGSSQSALSDDPVNNPVSGAPFVVSVWVSVLQLDSGFSVALSLSIAFVCLMCIFIAARTCRRSSGMMESLAHRGQGFSLLKLIGWFGLRASAITVGETKWYRVFVQFKRDRLSASGVLQMADEKREVFLLANEDWRQRVNKWYMWQRHVNEYRASRAAARGALSKGLSELGARRFAFLSMVKMDNRDRLNATMAGSSPWGRSLRTWEYVRRATLGLRVEGKRESIEWSRTHGTFLCNEALLLARLGLTPYLAHVERVVIAETEADEAGSYDSDGVKTTLIVSAGTADDGSDGDTADTADTLREQEMTIEMADGGNRTPLVLTGTPLPEPEELQVDWRGGEHGLYLSRFRGGSVSVHYLFLHEVLQRRGAPAPDAVTGA